MADDASPRSFGEQLRAAREEAGLSLAEFARRAHYSKGHVSKIERGRSPTLEFARQCDAVLGTAGTFAALVRDQPRTAVTAPQAMADELWVLRLSPAGTYEFGSQRSGDVIATGIMSWTADPRRLHVESATGAVQAYRVIFDQLRLLGQTAGPAELVPSLVAATTALRGIATRAEAPLRSKALLLAARFAEYAGWMAQEKGDERAAHWWTDRAVELASDGDDKELMAYASVRRALIALYRHDAEDTIALAQRAQHGCDHPRILGLALQREAQGHAIAGNELACRNLPERAAGLLATAKATGLGSAPLLGSSALDDPVVMSTGWCLHELGNSREAAAVLEPALARIPESALRARARYGARLALALASVRELEHACAVLEPMLDTLPVLDSATIRTDIASLTRTLSRWRSQPNVRETLRRLHIALHASSIHSVSVG